MAEVDTSSYPKPVAQPSLLDTVGKFQTLEQQKIGIDQSKLKLMNDHFQLMNAELSNLEKDPTVTREKIAQRLNSLGDAFNMPPQVRQKMNAEIPATNDPSALQQYLRTTRLRGLAATERINNIYGVPNYLDTGQDVLPVRVTPESIAPGGAPIKRQLPVETPIPTPEGTQFLGPQSPQVPVGARQVPGGIPGQYVPERKLPIAPSIEPKSPMSAIPTHEKFTERLMPSGPMASQHPMFEEGKRQYTEDLSLATQKLTAIKPAQQALAMMEGLRSGPGTQPWNNAVAFLKANGVLNIENENDPTAVYQEVSKKLADYLRSNPIGQRSDAAQVLSEAASPNPKQQINPALVKLTRDAIAQDRVQAARALAYKDDGALEKYPLYRGQFPKNIDNRAFTIDLLPPTERIALINLMKKNKDTPEGKKFWESLDLANKLDLDSR